MALLVKCLPCKDGILSSIPKITSGDVHLLSSAREMKTVRSLGLDLPSQPLWKVLVW